MTTPKKPPKTGGTPGRIIPAAMRAGPAGFGPGSWVERPTLDPAKFEVRQMAGRYYARRKAVAPSTPPTGAAPTGAAGSGAAPVTDPSLQGLPGYVSAYFTGTYDPATQSGATQRRAAYSDLATQLQADADAAAKRLGGYAQTAASTSPLTAGMTVPGATATGDQTLAENARTRQFTEQALQLGSINALPSAARLSGESQAQSWLGQRAQERAQSLLGARQDAAKLAADQASQSRDLAAQLRGQDIQLAVAGLGQAGQNYRGLLNLQGDQLGAQSRLDAAQLGANARTDAANIAANARIDATALTARGATPKTGPGSTQYASQKSKLIAGFPKLLQGHAGRIDPDTHQVDPSTFVPPTAARDLYKRATTQGLTPNDALKGLLAAGTVVENNIPLTLSYLKTKRGWGGQATQDLYRKGADLADLLIDYFNDMEKRVGTKRAAASLKKLTGIDADGLQRLVGVAY